MELKDIKKSVEILKEKLEVIGRSLWHNKERIWNACDRRTNA